MFKIILSFLALTIINLAIYIYMFVKNNQILQNVQKAFVSDQGRFGFDSPKPNWVSSTTQNPDHQMPPIVFKDDNKTVLEKIKLFAQNY